jgi:hypothetical protein
MARARQHDLFTESPDVPELPEPGTSRACTPDTLLDFMLRLGRCPTLNECKDVFGGILAPMFCAWELKRQGRWPKFGG